LPGSGATTLSDARAGALDPHGRPIVALPSGAPAWARDAIADRPEELRVGIGGAAIEALVWGDGEGPGMLLVHGHGAHADWWRPIAPQLAGAAGRVVALSLAGMGGSGWRDHYSLGGFADDLAGVAEATGLFAPGRRPWLVAHSFGCLPALAVAETHRTFLSGLALIDFYLPAPGRARARPEPRKPRLYASFEEGLARFRLSPQQDCPNPFLVDFVGRRTLRRVDDHWTWCTDPAASIPVSHADTAKRLGRVKLPLTIFRGERSRLVDGEVAAHVRDVAPPGTRHIDIPDADHHVLLDRPLALVAALRTMLAFGP
jgi:pimeloyl-ACP methyl ester carboxylesterase